MDQNTGSKIIKIVVIGPESTGKSTLCQQLAKHYQTLWCPEFARQYLLEHGTNYSFDQLLTIAQGQVALEDQMIAKLQHSYSLNSAPLLFIDTDMWVMKVWCDFVFGKCHPWILDQLENRHYNFYLLCNTDLPWVKDELREYPDLHTRSELFNRYKDIMENQNTPWSIISGNSESRLEMAIKKVDAFLEKSLQKN
jgi:NadR type nicotinamide-nucleotide adenylyltransferase